MQYRILGVVVLLILVIEPVRAIDFSWIEANTGDQSWQDGSAWNGPGFPNDADDAVDLAVPLGADLNLTIGASGVTVASLSIGGTSSAVTTRIDGGRLTVESLFGDASINSVGAAGAVNEILAPLHLVDERVNLTGTQPLSLGDITSVGQQAALRSVTSGLVVSVSGIELDDPSVEEGQNPMFALNNNADNQGTLDIHGVISGTGQLTIGAPNAQIALPPGTVVLRGDNTFSGRVLANRANIILAHDNALGLGDYKQGNPSNQFGFNFISDSDDRKISIPMQMAQWQTVRGDHSLEWAGEVKQTNSRGFVNLLPDGKVLTLSGPIYSDSGEEDAERTFTFDGTGTTNVTAGLHNNPDNPFAVGTHRKRGTGVMNVSGPSTYTGDTLVEAGTLVFADMQAMGETRSILVTGGAFGVATGSITNPDVEFLLDPISSGGLIVAADEADADLDFTFLPPMSLAGPVGGVNFVGSLIPADNTYRLGGGAGTITFSNSNQLTDDNSVLATNGGVVRVLDTHDYTGTTRIEGRYTTSVQDQAIANERNGTSNQLFVPTTLTTMHLENGGIDSSVGRSSSDAANLELQGGVLRYEGAGDITDRRFTLNTAGGTIDASGTGPVVFADSQAIAMATVPDQEGSIRGASNLRDILILETTKDLLIGMGVQGLDNIEPNTSIVEVIDETRVRMSNPVPDNPFLRETGTVTFTGTNRTLTLTGNNTDANTLKPMITDADDGAAVEVAKRGIGTWVLAGNNTYSGTTTVENGTLLVNGDHTGGDIYSVAASGALGGSGSIGSEVTVAGAILASGSTLAFDQSVSMAGGGVRVDLASLSTDTPLLQFTDLDLDSAVDFLEAQAGSETTAGDYLLATYSGLLSGEFDSVSADLNVNYDTPGQILVSVLSGNNLRGDFDNNGIVDLMDIDLLTPEIASGNHNTQFDLNGDNLLNGGDLALFLSDNVITDGNRLPGDADFDGEVAFADFLRLSGNFGLSGVWSEGDFDADGQVAFGDFLLLSGNFGLVASAQSVPEPGSAFLPLLIVSLLLCKRVHRNR